MCSQKEFFFLASPSRGLRLLAAFILVVSICILRSAALKVLNTAFLGGFEGDAGLYVWLVKHASSSIFTLPWFSTLPFYPYGGALAWSDNFILPGSLFGFFKSVSIGDIASYNLLILSAHFLNGYCSFRLLYALTEDALSSIAFGLLMLTFLPLEAHLGHPQLQFAFIIPLGILFIFKYIQKQTLIRAALIGSLIPLSFLTTVYFSLFLILIYSVLLGGFLLIHPKLLTRHFVITLLKGCVPVMLCLIPFVSPYLGTKELFGSRGLFEAFYFSATTQSLFSAPPVSLFYPLLSVYSHSEARLFAGFLILILAVIAFIKTFRIPQLQKQFWIIAALGIAALSFSLASIGNQLLKYGAAISIWLLIASIAYGLLLLGRLERKYNSEMITNRNILGVILLTAVAFLFLACGPLGNPEKGDFSLGLYGALYYVIPGFDSLRAIGRAGIVGVYLLSLMSYLILSQLRGARKLNFPTFLILLAIPIAENAHSIYPLDYPIKSPEVLSSIKLSSNAPIIGLPYAGELDNNGAIKSWSDFARRQVYFMNWFEDAQVASVNGYSGQVTKLMKDFPRRLAGFPDDRSLRELSMIAGLHNILVVPALNPTFNTALFEAKLGFYKDNLKIQAKDKDGNYLLNFSGESVLVPDFILRMPRNGAGLAFEITYRNRCLEKDTTLKLFDADDQSLDPIALISIPRDAKIHSVTLKLDNIQRSQRPLRIKFETIGCPLSIRETKLIEADSQD